MIRFFGKLPPRPEVMIYVARADIGVLRDVTPSPASHLPCPFTTPTARLSRWIIACTPLEGSVMSRTMEVRRADLVDAAHQAALGDDGHAGLDAVLAPRSIVSARDSWWGPVDHPRDHLAAAIVRDAG